MAWTTFWCRWRRSRQWTRWRARVPLPPGRAPAPAWARLPGTSGSALSPPHAGRWLKSGWPQLWRAASCLHGATVGLILPGFPTEQQNIWFIFLRTKKGIFYSLCNIFFSLLCLVFIWVEMVGWESFKGNMKFEVWNITRHLSVPKKIL